MTQAPIAALVSSLLRALYLIETLPPRLPHPTTYTEMGIIKRARRRLAAIAVLGIPLALVPTLSAQDLPSAEEVLAAHVEAIGGADAIEAVDYRHIISSTSMPALG